MALPSGTAPDGCFHRTVTGASDINLPNAVHRRAAKFKTKRHLENCHTGTVDSLVISEFRHFLCFGRKISVLNRLSVSEFQLDRGLVI